MPRLLDEEGLDEESSEGVEEEHEEHEESSEGVEEEVESEVDQTQGDKAEEDEEGSDTNSERGEGSAEHGEHRRHDQAASVDSAPLDEESDDESENDANGSEVAPTLNGNKTGNQSTVEAEEEPADSEGDVGDEATESSEEEEEEEDEEEFQAATSSEEVDEKSAVDRNNCIFCKQGEDQDPSEDFDTYLTCSICRDHAHQTCSRDSQALTDGDDLSTWRCPACVGSELEAPPSPENTMSKPRSSAPRLVRDLLPVSRGIQRPDAHSIFAQPLIADGRLRKRKWPTGEQPPMSEKRRRKASSRALAGQSTTAGDDSTLNRDSMDLDTPSATRSTRRASHKPVPLVRVIQQRPFHKDPPYKFILALHLDQAKIAAILSKPTRPKKRDRHRRKIPKIPPPPVYEAPIPKFPALPTSHLIFPSILTERESELNSKPYGGILSESDADTSRSLPTRKDREIFETARKEAEEERRRASAVADSEANGDGTTTTARTGRTVSGPPTKIKCIQFGKFVIDTFYASPYPEEYSHESRLFICEFCLKYLPSEFVAWRHKLKCPAKHPPGDEIYRDGSVSVWEVDGRKKTEYCQCLCLMAKMFLGSKTLYYDVEPFLFYILTEYDELGYHFVGYFSKEKRPTSLNNVSCILVMPIHQRKGYATFLIDFSYLLTRIEGKEGSPEKPLSDMGLTAYRSYWDLTISRHLLQLGLKPFSTKTLMDRTGMTADDVIHSLERLYAFIKDPITKVYAIRFDRKLYEGIVESNESKGYRQLQPEMLVWTPYVMGRSDHAILDDAPLQTVAPREEEDSESQEDGDEEDTPKPQSEPLGELVIGVKGASVHPEGMITDELKPHSPQESHSRSKSHSSHHESQEPEVDMSDAAPVPDTAPVNHNGQIAPGPPSTSAVDTAISTEKTQSNGLTNGYSPIVKHDPSATPDPPLTGYALAFRTHGIPPKRFQIDPAIPPSMLRSRSTKKRHPNSGFGRRQFGMNGGDTPATAAMMPVRSSPRNAGASGAATPTMLDRAVAGASTPVRRSGRSKLAHELTSLDGTTDEGEREAVDEEAKGEEEEEEEEDDDDESSESDDPEGNEAGEAEEDAEEGDEEDDDDEDEAEVDEDDHDEGEDAEDESSEAAVDEEDEEDESDDEERGGEAEDELDDEQAGDDDDDDD